MNNVPLPPDVPDIDTVIDCKINEKETVILYEGKIYVHFGERVNGAVNNPTLF